MIRLLTILALVLASGCVSVLPKARPAAPRYLIDAVETAAPGPAVSWSLAVEDPSSTRAYDTPKIAAIREPGRLEYLGNGEWADRAPRLLQAALIRSFENTGRILGVGERTTLPSSTYILQTDIRNLEADWLDGNPRARVALYARFMNARGKVFAARLFTAEAPAGAGTPSGLAKAFDAAVGSVIGEVVAWSFEAGAKAQTP